MQAQMEAAAPKTAPVVRYNHIMIDLETLATTADAVILSIGAVKFNLDGVISDEAFYCVCDLHSQNDRYISPDTLTWWIDQGENAKRVFSEPNKLSIHEALQALEAWVDRDDYLLWSNGADFDIPIINHALRHCGMTPLAKHWNHRCFRTLKNEYKSCPMPDFIGSQHNALMDAIHQAKCVAAIEQFKRNPPPVKGFAVKKVTP